MRPSALSLKKIDVSVFYGFYKVVGHKEEDAKYFAAFMLSKDYIDS